MHAVIMQKCFIFLCFTKLCSCVELYSPKKLLATSLGDPNCSTISSYLRTVGYSDSNSDSRFFKDDSISFFSFSLQHSCLESSFKYVLMALFFKMYLHLVNEIFDFFSVWTIIYKKSILRNLKYNIDKLYKKWYI